MLWGLWSQWTTLCSDAFEDTLFHAEVLDAFFGAFRIIELVAGSKSDASCQALCFEDIQLGVTSLQIVLHFSKTDQKGKGALIMLGACKDPALCPVLAVHQYIPCWGSGSGN